MMPNFLDCVYLCKSLDWELHWGYPRRDGVLNKVLYGGGGIRPEVQPLIPFIYQLWQKRWPFHTPSIHKWYPFNIPSIELCIPFNCCKYAFFKIRINKKPRTFPRLFHNHKMHLLALLVLLKTKMTDFPTPSYTSAGKIPSLSCQWNSCPFIDLKLEKGTPFGRSLPV